MTTRFLAGDPAVDREAFDGAIRGFKHRTPFRPFTISLVNGERLEIDRPDAIAIRAGTGLFAGPGGVPSVFDHEGVIAVDGDLRNGPPE